MVALEKKEESVDMKEMFIHICDERLSICDALEEIADSLPKRVDRQVCVHTARVLPQIIKKAHHFETEIFFPNLEKTKFISLDLDATLERLKNEQVADEYSGEELGDVLMSYGIGEPILGAEATGYMLRGFFEKLRRHVAFEKELFFKKP